MSREILPTLIMEKHIRRMRDLFELRSIFKKLTDNPKSFIKISKDKKIESILHFEQFISKQYNLIENDIDIMNTDICNKCEDGREISICLDDYIGDYLFQLINGNTCDIASCIDGILIKEFGEENKVYYNEGIEFDSSKCDYNAEYPKYLIDAIQNQKNMSIDDINNYVINNKYFKIMCEYIYKYLDGFIAYLYNFRDILYGREDVILETYRSSRENIKLVTGEKIFYVLNK